MVSTTLFQVIDARTSYNILLGRRWIHENGVVPSTPYKCFKYIDNNIVKTVTADTKPFSMTESFYGDAKYYQDNVEVEETLQKEDEDKERQGISLTYEEKGKVTLKEAFKGFTLPLTSVSPNVASTPPRPQQGNEEARRLKNDKEFGPKAYKLLTKAGYRPNGSSPLGKLPNTNRSHGDRSGLGYTPSINETPRAAKGPQFVKGSQTTAPIRIAIRRSTTNHITEESITPEKQISQKSVFDRLGDPSPKEQKPNVLDRLGSRIIEHKTSVFQRLDSSLETKSTVFQRLGTETWKKPMRSVFDRLGTTQGQTQKELPTSKSQDEEKPGILDDPNYGNEV